MEFFMFKMMFDDKTIVNPVNPEEVFTCKDLVEGIVLINLKLFSLNDLILRLVFLDYKICRKERRMQTQKKS